MADSNNDKKDRKQENPYKSKVNKWVIWTAVVIIIFVVLLLVFNQRSAVVNDEGESTVFIALWDTTSPTHMIA